MFVNLLVLTLFVNVTQASDICSTASFTNPNQAERGIGGTGITQHGAIGGTGVTSEGGIGGTGIDEHGGIGGTGDSVSYLLPDTKVGGTTIIGVVTGFASICVDGVEVHYDEQTPVFDNGKASKLSSLAVGKMVMLKADNVAGRMQARAIGLVDAVAGPVGHMDIARKQMQVMGQTVKLNPGLINQMGNIASGVNVRVSGHRLATGEVLATHVNIAPSANSASTIGLVTAVSAKGVTVNGTSVNISDKKALQQLKVGTEVNVSGTWGNDAIKANRIETQPTQKVLKGSDVAIVEGFVNSTSKGKISLAGTQVQIKHNGSDNKGKVVKVEMRRDSEGNWVSDKVDERKEHLFYRNLENKSEDSDSYQDSSDSSGSGSSDSSGHSNSSDSSGHSNSSDSSGHSNSSEDARVDSHKTEAPKEEKIKVESQKVESPKVEKSRVETPKIEKSRVESPKIEKSRVETPKIERIRVESPRTSGGGSGGGSHGK